MVAAGAGLPTLLVDLLGGGPPGQRAWPRWAAYGASAVAGALPLIWFRRSQSAQVPWIPPLTGRLMIGPGSS
ncbi:hypothetical protein ACFCXT_38525 [Streptomyces vinaceus]|uniref:hypothetical protein n=1 Tax=Streptomyces vinaceus TaxID=1960 RepID=UPI0035E12D34